MADEQAERSTQVAGRATQLFLAAVIAVAFIGFFVGLRQGVPQHEPPEFVPAPAERDPDAIPALSYDEFDRRRHGPNRGWQSRLEDLEQPEVDMFAPFEVDEAERQRLLAARAERRAYDGAPPVVPHPIDQMSSTSCMACHSDQGLYIGELYAPPMSHEFLSNCIQCHVEQQSPDLGRVATVANLFEGQPSPGPGSRAWPGAPPTVPHHTFMRDNCMSCHGPSGPDPIRTTHPWQTNCLQCHAPSAELDQAIFDDAPRFLPPPEVDGP